MDGSIDAKSLPRNYLGPPWLSVLAVLLELLLLLLSTYLHSSLPGSKWLQRLCNVLKRNLRAAASFIGASLYITRAYG